MLVARGPLQGAGERIGALRARGYAIWTGADDPDDDDLEDAGDYGPDGAGMRIDYTGWWSVDLTGMEPSRQVPDWRGVPMSAGGIWHWTVRFWLRSYRPKRPAT